MEGFVWMESQDSLALMYVESSDVLNGWISGSTKCGAQDVCGVRDPCMSAQDEFARMCSTKVAWGIRTQLAPVATLACAKPGSQAVHPLFFGNSGCGSSWHPLTL